MKSLAPNTLLQNRYLVVQLIGKGGMGEVYLAVDQRLGSAVALKRMLFTDEEALGNAFEREAKMLARLRHPALTKVSDHFTENETQYLVMEHISGEDLAKRLELNQKPFPLSWVLFWADQLLDALSYLHSHEPPIIHRDVKPQNLKLTNENHIILLDFGLAKNAGGETRLSTTGDVVAYTPHYASMEQIRGTGTTARSDIYSLCATIYQLLTNDPPPDALSRAESVLNNLPDPLRRLDELNPEVPQTIAEVVTKGMSLGAEQRFTSAKEMQAALREAFSNFQKGMSADTVAFNISDELKSAGNKNELRQSDINTAVIPAPPSGQPLAGKTEPMQINSVLTANDTVASHAGSQAQNLEATIPFASPFVFDEQEKTIPAVGEKTELIPDLDPPMGAKTEAMPFASTPELGAKTVVSPIDLPAATEIKNENSSDTGNRLIGEKTELMPVDETGVNSLNVSEIIDKENRISQNSFTPPATVPLVNLDNQAAEMPVFESAEFVKHSAGKNRTEDISPDSIASSRNDKTMSKPQKKEAAASGKGGSKTMLILGVLGLLGVLAAAGAGVGLYVLKPELFTTATPTPQPTVEPTAQPTAEPTITPAVEPTAEINANIENNLTNSSNANTDSNTNSQITEKTPPKTVTPNNPTTTRQDVPPVKNDPPVKQNTPPVKQKTPPVKQNTPPPSKKIEQ